MEGYQGIHVPANVKAGMQLHALPIDKIINDEHGDQLVV
jgi:hypothetical protein